MGITSLEPTVQLIEEMVERRSDINLILLQINKLDSICNKVYKELELKLSLLEN